METCVGEVAMGGGGDQKTGREGSTLTLRLNPQVPDEIGLEGGTASSLGYLRATALKRRQWIDSGGGVTAHPGTRHSSHGDSGLPERKKGRTRLPVSPMTTNSSYGAVGVASALRAQG